MRPSVRGVEWVVHIRAEGGARDAVREQMLCDLTDELRSRAGIVTGPAEGSLVGQYGAVFDVDADHPVEVLRTGLEIFEAMAARVGLPRLPYVSIDLQTAAELEALQDSVRDPGVELLQPDDAWRCPTCGAPELPAASDL